MASLMNSGNLLASTAFGVFGSKISRKWRNPLRSASRRNWLYCSRAARSSMESLLKVMLYKPLFDDLLDDVAELGQAAVAQFAGMGFRRAAGGADAQGHVGVLGVREDEVLAADGIGVDAPQFLIEGFFGHKSHVINASSNPS